ncbi:hypothetical protein ROZALSC1DRAFT_26133 [Rozella allomycis CSF55]|uniref:Uncharacterized protein n=1 Tax=Rozella allomycis (strain CSF55) TaxID=988480 RepID=A0A4P9YC48_ROZAC|nr:hypothetical protein ROZALSC1DRAFT_26133 [Rozella allomycis CSF55]
MKEEFEDLKKCYSILVEKKKEKDIKAVDVIVEYLISLISNESQLLRNIADLCFNHFCSEMTLESISSIMNVLQGEGVDEGDDEVEESEGDGGSEGVEEESDGESEREGESESDSESEDSNNEESEVEGESMVANEDNDQDNEDEDLSDSEMFQFDQQLANIFSEKKRLKKESKEILFQF